MRLRDKLCDCRLHTPYVARILDLEGIYNQ
jgi:hypothetical protein